MFHRGEFSSHTDKICQQAELISTVLSLKVSSPGPEPQLHSGLGFPCNITLFAETFSVEFLGLVENKFW